MVHCLLRHLNRQIQVRLVVLLIRRGSARHRTSRRRSTAIRQRVAEVVGQLVRPRQRQLRLVVVVIVVVVQDGRNERRGSEVRLLEELVSHGRLLLCDEAPLLGYPGRNVRSRRARAEKHVSVARLPAIDDVSAGLDRRS